MFCLSINGMNIMLLLMAEISYKCRECLCYAKLFKERKKKTGIYATVVGRPVYSFNVILNVFFCVTLVS